MKEITLETTVADLLNNYDGMKDTLISINPKFKKLNNPILRRTLAKLATVKQAAIIGGMEPIELLNRLRESVGQEPLSVEDSSNIKKNITKPSWVDETKIALTFDANEILDKDKNPLAEVNRALKSLNNNEIIALKSDFMPEPLIDEFLKQGKKTYTKEINESEYITYITQ